MAVIVLDVEPTEEDYALAVARSLRRSPSPSGAAWLPVPERPVTSLADELARTEALFFDLDLEGAERAATDTLLGIDGGEVVVDDAVLLLRTLIRAAQVFDARGANDAADAALTRASAVRPGFELSAADFPPSLIARRARLAVPSARVTLEWVGLPDGARVHVDGTAVRAGRVDLAVGRHVVRVTASGYQTRQRAYDVLVDQTLPLSLEVDPERLDALPDAAAQRFLTLHDAQRVRLQLTTTSEGRRCRLLVPGEPTVTVLAPLDEEPAALAARLTTERDAGHVAQTGDEVRRRRRRWIVTSAAVAVVGAGTGAYFGLRPEASGWRANGQLGGAP